uniref:Neprosin PEP catalytic domain-containing protein n=2 Tax=Cajanus cajan TaxID=3821 RepID=A0A151TQP1_CAJCA|nr:hypothetical protein KK1_008475 [Cajanus cajan]
MKHQMNFNSMESQIENFPLYPRELPIERYVTLDTTPNTTYHGAYANVNICAVSPLQKNQYSLGQIYAQGGPPAELNTIQAGWGVSPDLYGDSKTRLTGFWKVQGDQKSAGCFNVLCPGFIQVHQTVGFGTILEPSQTGSTTKLYLNFIIEQDNQLGNWWLTLKGNINIGYWPKDIVPHLGNGASVIRFGGETGSMASVSNPPMGTGYLPEAKYRYACYFARLKILDSQFKEQEVKPDDMKIYRNADPKCYDLLYPGYSGEQHRQAFLYGGPGAPADQCGPL